jgi:hypothetical protein
MGDDENDCIVCFRSAKGDVLKHYFHGFSLLKFTISYYYRFFLVKYTVLLSSVPILILCCNSVPSLNINIY